MNRSWQVLASSEPSDLVPDAASTALPRAAWDDAFRAHNHRVVVSLVAMGVRADVAMDIAQAAWTRLIEQDRAGKLHDVRLPGIAIAQARLFALEARRREAVERRRMAGSGSLDEPRSSGSDQGTPDAVSLLTAADDPERTVLNREELEHAVEVIAAASPSAQRVFRLVYGEPPLPHARVATQVGLSVQRVRQIVCELRKKIRDVFDDGGDPS
jgi:RNA polymerase sigma-70 factor (ECF subfamily)